MQSSDRHVTHLAVRCGGLDDEQVHELLQAHLAGMHENSPPESVFALDLSGLRSPDITFYSAWDGSQLAGIGALKELSPQWGEIKSMRTHAKHLKKGVASLLLEQLLAEARSRSYRRLSLETGKGPSFEAALSLYAKYGFEAGSEFADYEPSEFSQYLHLDL